MLKKELGLLLLIVIVGAVVAVLNPRFLSPINLSNTANLIGLFGLFSLAQAFVIISGGIELSVGSIIALARRGLRRPDRQCRIALGPGVAGWSIGIGMAMGVGARPADHPHPAPAVRRDPVRPPDLSRHRPLVHRGRHRRLRLRPEVPVARMAHHRPHARRAAQHAGLRGRGPGAGSGPAPVDFRPLPLCGRQERGGRPLFRCSDPAHHRHRLRRLLRADRTGRRVHRHVHALDLALLARQLLRALRHRRLRPGRLLPARRRGLDPGRGPGHRSCSRCCRTWSTSWASRARSTSR